MIQVKDIAQLRQLTGAGIMDCKQALAESGGDMEKAKKWLQKKGLDKAAKKKDRETSAGIVYAYVHHGSQVGALITLTCETDFVARTEDFNNLAKEIAMQVASMAPKDVSDLLGQPYIRDGAKKVEDLVKETVAKVGENIKIAKISRLEI